MINFLESICVIALVQFLYGTVVKLKVIVLLLITTTPCRSWSGLGIFTRVQALFPSLTVILMEIPLANCLPNFFPIDDNFFKMTLSHTFDRGSRESLINNSNVSAISVKLLETIKI